MTPPAAGQIWFHKYKRYHVRLSSVFDDTVRLARIERVELGGHLMWLRPKRSLSRAVRRDVLINRYRFAESPMPDSVESSKTTAANPVAPE